MHCSEIDLVIIQSPSTNYNRNRTFIRLYLPRVAASTLRAAMASYWGGCERLCEVRCHKIGRIRSRTQLLILLSALAFDEHVVLGIMM